jgi:hypothetical protein
LGNSGFGGPTSSVAQPARESIITKVKALKRFILSVNLISSAFLLQLFQLMINIRRNKNQQNKHLARFSRLKPAQFQQKMRLTPNLRDKFVSRLEIKQFTRKFFVDSSALNY